MCQRRPALPFAFGGGLAQVVQQRARGADGLRTPGQAESFEILDAELLGEHAFAVFAAENPFFEARLDAFAEAARRAASGRGEPAGENSAAWRGSRISRGRRSCSSSRSLSSAEAPANSVARNSPVETST